MAEKDKKVTFELKDLTYMELVDIYQEVNDFLYFLSEAKVSFKDHKERKSDIADDITDDDTLELEEGEETENIENLETAEEEKEPPKSATKNQSPSDDDDDEDDVSLPKMKGA